jgi:MraZ protein
VFTGSYSISLDPKGRIAIPIRIRDALLESCGGRLVVTAHTEDRCLLVYPEPEWLTLLPQIEALPSFNKASQRVKRILIGYASTLDIDANGRVLVPPTLRDYANLDKKMMLVGQGKKLELWSEASWLALLDVPGDDEIPSEMLSLSL